MTEPVPAKTTVASNGIDHYLAFGFGVTFVIILLVIALVIKEPTAFAF